MPFRKVMFLYSEPYEIGKYSAGEKCSDFVVGV
jgi:hypothetical protein